MVIRRHGFSERFIATIQENVELDAEQVIAASGLLRFLHSEMKAASRGAKARKNLANHSAIYATVEDYRNKCPNPDEQIEQLTYGVDIEFAQYSDLLNRARTLHGCSKIQNHGFNNRLRDKFVNNDFGLEGPILRNPPNYSFNQDLLIIEVGDAILNISAAVIAVIDEYLDALREKFLEFIQEIERVVNDNDHEAAIGIIEENLADNSDARQFEITSFSVMHSFYSLNSTYIGENPESLKEVAWNLCKTGRTNANDGGIDFVLQPFGKFFQVTEDTNVRKWFLDIEKVSRYPLNFVVKDSRSSEDVLQAIREDAIQTGDYSEDYVEQMVESIQEIITVPNLIEMFNHCTQNGLLGDIMDQILIQSRVEFNIED